MRNKHTFHFVSTLAALGLFLGAAGLLPQLGHAQLSETDNVDVTAVVNNAGTVTNVTNLQADVNDEITLTWDYADPSIDRFEVFYRTNPGDPLTGPIILDKDDRSFDFDDPDPDTNYEFTLVVVKGGNSSSGVTVTAYFPPEEEEDTSSPPPSSSNGGGSGGSSSSDPEDENYVAVPVPTNITAVPSDDLSSVEVSWSSGGGGAYPVVEYEIYRTTPGEPFPSTPYTTVPASESGYTDGNVEEGETYQYMVRAIDSRSRPSGTSEIAEVTVLYDEPESIVRSMDAIYTSEIVSVPYRAYSAGGLSFVELYVSKDGGSYELYKRITFTSTATTAEGSILIDTSQLQGDGEYAFYTVAGGQLGQVEATPAEPDRVIIVDTTPPLPPDVVALTEINEEGYEVQLIIENPSDATEMFIGVSGESDNTTNTHLLRQWVPVTESVTVLFDEPGFHSISVTFRDASGLQSESTIIRTNFYALDNDAQGEDQDNDAQGEDSDSQGNENQNDDNQGEDNDGQGQNNDKEKLDNQPIGNFAKDTDGDGMSDGDELTYYFTDPEEFTEFDTGDFFFTTNIANNSVFHRGEELAIYGKTLPGIEVEIYVIDTLTGEISYLGTVVSDEEGRYIKYINLPNIAGNYDFDFRVLGNVIERDDIHILASVPFYSHIMYTLDNEFVHDVHALRNYIQGNSQQKVETIRAHQKIDFVYTIQTRRPRIGVRNFFADEADSLIKEPILIEIVWQSGDFWLAERREVRRNEHIFHITPPKELPDGQYLVTIQAVDNNNVRSYPRLLQFPLYVSDLHSVAPAPMIDYIKKCSDMLYNLPEFWLWMLAALLGGILLTLFVQILRDKKKEQKESPQQETTPVA